MRWGILALVAICAVVLFAGLDTIGLVDVHEARDAQVARELQSAHQVLTPTVAGEPLFEKPVLAYAPDLAARLWSDAPATRSRQLRALAAALLVLLTASIGAGHFGARAGLWAGIVLATSFAMPLAARTDGTQVMASLLGWLGCAGLADAMFGRRAGRGLRLVVAYGALAAAAVSCGPLPALWPLAGAALYLVLTGTPGEWKRVAPLAGIVLIVGISLPWYGTMFGRHGTAFLAHVPFFPYAEDPRGPWYLGLVMLPSFLVIGFFPWSTLLPGAMLHAATWWRARRRAMPIAGHDDDSRPAADPVGRERLEESAAHFYVACLIAALVPIALYRGAPLPSALPAMPAAALLCGRLLDHLFEDATRTAAALARAVLMLAIVGSVIAVLLALVAGRIREASDALRLLAPVVLVTAWAPLLANLIRRPRLAAVLMTLPVVLGTPIVAFRLLPQMEDYLNTRSVAEAMSVVSPERAELVLIEPAPPSLHYYSRRNLVTVRSAAAALEHHRAADGLAYLAFRPRREREIAKSAELTLEIVTRTPSMVLARLHPR